MIITFFQQDEHEELSLRQGVARHQGGVRLPALLLQVGRARQSGLNFTNLSYKANMLRTLRIIRDTILSLFHSHPPLSDMLFPNKAVLSRFLGFKIEINDTIESVSQSLILKS